MGDKDRAIINKKCDITRLKNLLRNYRDSIITNVLASMKHIEPVRVIEQVDRAIKLITYNLR